MLRGSGRKWHWPVPLILKWSVCECFLSRTYPEMSKLPPHYMVFRPLFPHCMSMGCLPSLQEQPQCLLCSFRAMHTDPFKLQALSLPGPRVHKIQPLLFFKPMALGKCSPCAFPCVLLSLALLHDHSSFPSAAPTICFSLQPHLSTSCLL